MIYFINSLTQQVVETSQPVTPATPTYASKGEAESMLMAPGYLANLLVESQKPGSELKPSRNQILRISEYLELLTHIHQELDAEEWTTETCQNLADYFEARDIQVRDINDLTCCHCQGPHHHDECPEKAQGEQHEQD